MDKSLSLNVEAV